MKKTSAFQNKVYEAVKQIPPGHVSTYKIIGEHIGCRAYQAVGQALRHNPFAPAVPCHRVIASDLSLGGFQGRKNGPAVQTKKALLLKEGVRFDRRGRLLAHEKVFLFSTSGITHIHRGY